MRNENRWQPTKFVRRQKRLRASRDRRHVGIASRLMADLVASRYQDYLETFARGRLLDLGCGEAPLFDAYKPFVASVTCADWPSTFHEMIHVDVACNLEQPLPFRDAAFDTVLLSDVLEHAPRPRLLFRQVARVLAPGGTLLLNTPFYYWIHEEPYDYCRHTRFSLLHMCREAGLAVTQIVSVGGVAEVLADLVSKNVLRLPLLGNVIAMLLQRMTLGLGRTGVGRLVATRTGRQFPFFYFLIATKPASSEGPP